MFDPQNQWPELLLPWLTRYTRQPVEFPTTDWRTVLSSGSAFWRLEGGACGDYLVRGVTAVTMLAAELQRNPAQDPSASLLTWQELAAGVSTYLPYTSFDAWQNLFAEADAKNLIVGGLVGKALERGLEKARLPQTAVSALLPLIQHSRRSAAAFPMPPAWEPGVEPAEYLLPAQNQATWKLLAESLEMSLADLKSALQAVCTRPELTNVAIASDDILQLARCGAAGWPILVAEQRRKTERLLTLLQSLTRARAVVAAFSAGLVRAGSTFIPGTTLAHAEQTRAAVPKATAVSTTELHQTGFAPLLAQLAKQLESIADGQASALARRCNELYQGSHDQPAQESDPAWQRRLLSCLIDLDELYHKRRNVAWIKSARDVIRRVIAELGCYLILDSQLIGSLPETYAGRIEAVGWIESNALSGTIAAVVQPGYELLNLDGSNTSLCRAKILLAR